MGSEREILRNGWWRIVPLLALCLGLLVSCAKRGEQEPAGSTGIRREFERGPVKVVLTTDRSEATIAERIRLNLEIIADEAYEARLPPFGEKLDQFGIVDYKTDQPELLDGSKVRIGRTYVLEPFLSGEYKIPPMKIPFVQKGDASGKEYEIETEELVIKVTSLLPAKVEALTIHEVTDPVGIPRAWKPVGWVGALAVSALAVLAVILARARRKRSAAAAEAVPAHELALRELEALIAEDLPGKGELKRFYQRISDLLRAYIENRFGLRAPEQTTEEFLAALGGSAAFPVRFKPLLDTFLKHCDLVKFAELQPTTADIQKTFDSCRDFIVGTKAEEELTTDH